MYIYGILNYISNDIGQQKSPCHRNSCLTFLKAHTRRAS